ncbi:hypothetical protein ACFYXS_02835 [Streptomyces sp. NPDC002574]|uniref:hypothetical protein n=1 Tax=Streptomyces sp. NPDC002574 TaxID=3364652 RepID=UPI003683BCF4
MAETAFFLGEGGHVWEMDLPLREQHARDEKEGRLVRVNPDGSPLTEPADQPDVTHEVPKKPNKGSSKADWVAWAVHQGLDPQEAEEATREALIERYHGAE